jgi:hypothetical protein
MYEHMNKTSLVFQLKNLLGVMSFLAIRSALHCKLDVAVELQSGETNGHAKKSPAG